MTQPAGALEQDDDLTLTEAATAIATGAATSEQLVQTCLDAIARSNARTGWFVRVEAERALAQARDCDRRRAAGEKLGALDGVPLAHKDMFARAGALMECGSQIMRGHRPDHTATVIARLEAAGAVTLGALHMAVSRMMWKLLLWRLRLVEHDEVRRRDQEALRREALRGSASRRLCAW
jgi:Asp-tRNA(Asn)/Glu-tRNA(Gln) amidotransferase A subunit family amidase